MLTRLIPYTGLVCLTVIVAACSGTTSSGTSTQISGSFGGTTAPNAFTNNTTAGSIAVSVQQ